MSPGEMRMKIIVGLSGARARARKTQALLAEKIGKTHQAVARWEGGTSDPTLENLCRWADALGYDVVLAKREKAE